MDNKEYLVIVNEMYNDSEYQLLLPEKELEKVVQMDTYSNCKISRELTDKELEQLNLYYKDILKDEEFEDLCFYEQINQAIIASAIKNCEASDVDEIEEVNDQNYLYDDNTNLIQYDLCDDDDYTWSYEYWDGHNHKRIFLEYDPYDCIKIEANSSGWINLDTWDGKNWKFQRNHNHGKLIKLKGVWILNESTNYWGCLDTAEIFYNIEDWLEDNSEYLDKETILKIKDLAK